MKNSKTGSLLIFRKLIPAVILAAGFFSCKTNSISSSDVISFEAMNTFMTIKAFGKTAASANKAAKEKILQIEKLISVTDSQSEVYKINNYDDEIKLSNEVKDLLTAALNAAYTTDGAFNPFLYPITKEWGFTTKNYHVPEENRIKALLPLTDFTKAEITASGTLKKQPSMQLDFGGIGKGYAGDMAIKTLKEKGISSAILDLGGNVQALGTKPDGSAWNIGLKNPWKTTSEPVIALKIQDCAVITSGGYERHFTGDDGKEYVHIFDSTTGHPVNNDLVSVTIITKNGITGDALSTALFAMGKEKAQDFWKNCKTHDFDFILLCKDFSAVYSEDLKEKLTALFDFSNVEICTK